MKAFRLIFKGLLLLALLTGCNNKPKIGFLMDTLSIDRWEKDKELFEKQVEELGAIPLVRVANGNSPKQFEQATQLLYEGVDVLVVIPVDLHASRDIVKSAHEKGVPVISYDRMIRDCNVDYYVSTDNIRIGELQAGYLSKMAPTGSYALLDGPTKDYNATLLHLGWMNVLQPLIEKGDINIVIDEYVNEWDAQEAFTIIKNYLSGNNPDLDVIIAGNDELAGGAIRALRQFNLKKKVLVAGQDAELNAIRNIVAGDQTITIYKPIDALVSTAANMAIKLANKEPINTSITVNNGYKLVPSVLLTSQVVNQQNIQLTVVSEGYLDESDIFDAN
ncbi:D-xylose ABC transporter substrate-binding protein [Thermophagus xiamenensis]|uniref:Xylose-binding protein n=1 Tax=Thermophagus xiamenensis TaxID=385682 RepID=A0A1I2B473_9BACT|nr:substrate-binding domain-containing protein [Thermophagus xiamenensis]SFE50974.1 xylose-binding protein [Thermophagus xiamenensis]